MLTIHIPTWLLWSIGATAVLTPLLYFAVLGIALSMPLKCYKFNGR